MRQSRKEEYLLQAKRREEKRVERGREGERQRERGERRRENYALLCNNYSDCELQLSFPIITFVVRNDLRALNMYELHVES